MMVSPTNFTRPAKTLLPRLHLHSPSTLLRFSSPVQSYFSSSSSSTAANEKASTSAAADGPDHPADAATVVQGPSLLASTGIHRPSPSIFHLPGLRSLPFWTAPPPPDGNGHGSSRRCARVAYNDPVISAAIAKVESNYELIRSEYFSAVLGQGSPADDASVRKPLQPDYDAASSGGEHTSSAPSNESPPLHTGSWDWHSYIQNGMRNETFRERCPKTAEIVDQLAEDGALFDDTPFGFCFYSTLHGNSAILPHSGPMNLRLRMHLPLVVPTASAEYSPPLSSSSPRPFPCGMRVADQYREWCEGSAIVFDDSYVHEVWNNTDEPRVLLLIDLWHPDVRNEERARIRDMFEYARGKGWIGK